MSTQPQPSSSHSSSAKQKKPLKIALLAFLAGALLCVLAIFAIVSGASSSPWNIIWAAVMGRSTQLDMSQPTVVDRIQKLQRLETVVYNMDKIVSGGHESSILPDFLAGDKLLMLVHGEVVAGVDFANLRPGDVKVKVKEKQILLHLPAAQIFSTRLDSTKTRVYSRQTGLLVSSDQNLESQVRQEAERQLHDAALGDGILKNAQQNAQATLTSFLQGLGFEKIEFE